MKRFRLVLLLVLGIVAGLFLFKDLIAAAALAGGIKAVTGLDANIQRMQVGLVHTAVGITGLRILNPAGFPERVMSDVPEIYVDYRLSPFLKGKVHLETVRLHLREFRVVKASDGTLNLRTVKALQPETQTEQARQQARTPGRAPAFRIDVLELKVGTVIFKDYTTTPPQVREFHVNIDERYEHITNPYTFAGLVVSRALLNTTVDQLANFDVQGLQATVTDALRLSAGKLTGGLTEGATAVQKAGKDTLGLIGDATGRLKNAFGN